jgi:hypothetical protein
MVAAAVANERRAGTLDQLRMTPLSSLGLAIGMIVGVPARLYLLCVGPLVLHVVASFAGCVPLTALAQSLAVLGAGTAASCALGLCVALAPRQESGGTFAALGVAALLGMFSLLTAGFACDRHLSAWAYLHPAGAFDAVMLAPHDLWQRMVLGSWRARPDSSAYGELLGLVPLASVTASLLFAAFLLRAACRKLAAPQQPLFAKTQAVALFAGTAAAMLLPLGPAGLDGEFGVAAAYGFSALMLPVLVMLGLYATPTFEAWAVAQRGGRRLSWRADDASAHRAVWLMEAVWALLLMLACRQLPSWDDDELLGLAWTALTATTLPIYLLFASTRYSTVAARCAFGVAICVHVGLQLIAIGTVRTHDVRGFAGTFVTLAAIAAFAVPAWTAWRQRVLRLRTTAR